MPLTFLSHQAPVLPLKMAWPRWFDGTALVIGSMAPDLFFVAHGTDLYPDAHGSVAAFMLCLPLTLVITWVIKRVVAGPLAAHLPDAGQFHLRDYGRLDSWRWPTNTTGSFLLILSAMIGALSHVLIDSFTHGFGWVVQHVDALRLQAFLLPEWASGRPVYVHDFLQVGGTVIGAGITIWCLHVIGQRRLLVSWCPAALMLKATAASRRLLITWSALALVVGLAVGVLAASYGGAQDFIVRVTGVTFVGVALGCVNARRSMEPVGGMTPAGSSATDETSTTADRGPGV